MRCILAVAGALIATVLLAGCTSSGAPAEKHPSTPSSSKSSAPPSKATGALPAGVAGATDVPVKVANSLRLRADVVLSTCADRTGGWEAGGTVRNPGRSTQQFLITVFFTTNRATVIGTATKTVAVAPGKSRAWSASSQFHAAKPTLCVLRGVGAADHGKSG